jgi:tripartite-type tricarboxylate transporter receptor subunit TctC
MGRNILRFSGILGLLIGVHIFVFSASAIDYPTKPITLICAYGAGGASDITARAVASELERFLGQPVVVVNKPGATGALAMSFLTSQKPDGYTIAQTPGSFFYPYFMSVSYDVTKISLILLEYVGGRNPLYAQITL